MSGANITSNTIPSSAISGGISVSLQTTGTIPVPISNQIGYTQYASILNDTYTYPNGVNTITTLSLIGPVESVWVVHVGIYSEKLFTGFSWGCLNGSMFNSNTYKEEGWRLQNCICGAYTINVPQIQSSGINVIKNSTYGNLLVLGFNGNNVIIKNAFIRATRIA